MPVFEFIERGNLIAEAAKLANEPLPGVMPAAEEAWIRFGQGLAAGAMLKTPTAFKLAPRESHDGLKRKYIVIKSNTGEVVQDCFVLRPDRDPAAKAALIEYAKHCQRELAEDITRWIQALDREGTHETTDE